MLPPSPGPTKLCLIWPSPASLCYSHSGSLALGPLHMLFCLPQAVLPQTFALPSSLLISHPPNQFMCPHPHLSDGAIVFPSAHLQTWELALISLYPTNPVHWQTLASLLQTPSETSNFCPQCSQWVSSYKASCLHADQRPPTPDPDHTAIMTPDSLQTQPLLPSLLSKAFFLNLATL